MKLNKRIHALETGNKVYSVMGWDDALMLLMAATSTASALNPPKNDIQTPGGAVGAQPGGMMNASPLAPQAPTAPGAAPVQPINTDPLQGIASALATTGPPPAQAAPIPTTGKPQTGPPAPSEDPIVQGKKNEESTKSIWAALPQAIAMAAPILGLTGNDNRQIPAPVAGGVHGASAFQSPVRRPSIGEILNSIPRLR